MASHCGGDGRRHTAASTERLLRPNGPHGRTDRTDRTDRTVARPHGPRRAAAALLHRSHGRMDRGEPQRRTAARQRGSHGPQRAAASRSACRWRMTVVTVARRVHVRVDGRTPQGSAFPALQSKYGEGVSPLGPPVPLLPRPASSGRDGGSRDQRLPDSSGGRAARQRLDPDTGALGDPVPPLERARAPGRRARGAHPGTNVEAPAGRPDPRGGQDRPLLPARGQVGHGVTPVRVGPAPDGLPAPARSGPRALAGRGPGAQRQGRQGPGDDAAAVDPARPATAALPS